jgi:50S ribosomal protein L16 3-hydroxylase
MFAPMPRAAFLRDHWLTRPCIAHGPLARFTDVVSADLSGIEVDALLSGRVKVDAQIRTPQGQFVALAVEPANARPAYDAGIQLYIHLDPREPGPLQAWSASLHRELGVPPHWGEIGVYAAKRAGLGVDWHFDRNENLMLQLAGRKVWKLAPNGAFEHPMTNQLLNGPIHPLNAIARTRGTHMVIPSDVETVTFEAGTAAYIPRGHWHETESGSEGSLSVAFTWSLRTWGEWVARRLLNELLTDPNFRRVAPMVCPGDAAGVAASRLYIESRLAPAIRAFADRISANPELLLCRQDG